MSSCALLVAIVTTHAACSSNEDAAATESAQGDAGPAPAVPGNGDDAGAQGANEANEGELVTDDGDVPEIVQGDASTEEVGADGGLIFQPGCASVTPGPYVASSCSSRATTFTSSGFESGTYLLASVRVLGNSTFCSDTFTVREHAGALVVMATSPTTASLRFYDKYRAPAKPLITAVNRYQLTATANGTDLTLGAPVCAAGTPAPATAKLGSGTADGKKYVMLQLPYGASGKAVYRFVEP